MRKSLALVVALVALLGAFLSGCGHSPATAATVGDATITESQVERAAAKLSELNEGNPAEARVAAVSILAQKELARQVSQARPEVAISAEERQAQLVNFKEEALRDPELKSMVDGLVDLRLLQAKLGPDGLQNALAGIPVELNPRYGSWDGAGADGQASSLSTKWTQR